jgi:hypothetical protein
MYATFATSLVSLDPGPKWRSVQAKPSQDSPRDRGINGIKGLRILCVAAKRRDSAMMAREKAAVGNFLWTDHDALWTR